MQELLREYLNELGSKQKKRRRNHAIAAIFAVFVVGSVIWAMARSGIAMTGEAKCGLEEHTHDDTCYQDVLICEQEESEGHQHTDACYTTESVLICEQEENEEHTHGEECYQTESTLACGQEESEGHQHTDGCYESYAGCGKEEHIHSELRYIDTNADIEDSSKWDEQYQNVAWKDAWAQDLVEAARMQLGYTESSDNYTVADDGSSKGYTRYGQFAGDVYADWDAAFVNFCIHYAGIEEAKMFPKETDTVRWYEEFAKANENNAAAYLTAPEGYVPVEGDLIFFEKEDQETTFQMGIVSEYNEEKNEIKVIEGNSDNQVKENEYDVADEHIFAYIKTTEVEIAYKAAKAEAESPAEAPEKIEGEEDVENADAKETPAIEKIYNGEGFIVTASYSEEAEIPEEAELVVKQITPDTDEEHYAERESEFREMMKDENSVMKVLLDIGFYVNGEEIEPKSAVKITVQFLNENGLAEGAPITVVHFANEGTEVLDGGTATNNSTTFQMDSFSEIGIGESTDVGEETPGAQNEAVPVLEVFDYEDEAFRISFHVEGDAVITGKKTENIASDVSDEGSAEEEEASDEDPAEGEEASGETEEIAPGETEADGTDENVSGESDEGDTASKTVVEQNGFRFEVERLKKDSEKYQAFAAFAAANDEKSEEILFHVIEYKLFYEDMELDLTNCKVTATIRPVKKAKEYLADAGMEGVNGEEESADEPTADEEEMLDVPALELPEASQASQIAVKNVSGMLKAAGAPEGGTERETETADIPNEQIKFTAYRMTADAEIEGSDSIILEDEVEDEVDTEEGFDGEEDEAEEGEIIVDLEGDSLAIRGSGTPNHPFKVQYYANLEVVDQDATGKAQLNVIDTSSAANGGTKKLPENGVSPKMQKIAIGNDNKIVMKTELTKVYKDSGPLHYYTSPSLFYFNALKDNPGYELKEIWILKEGKSEESTAQEDWRRYNYDTDLHFTNRESGFIEGETFREAAKLPTIDSGVRYVLIGKDTVVRLVYDPTSGTPDFGTNFYDYDISTDKAEKDGVTTLYTEKYGINSDANYTGGGAKYAFGNVNTGTAYGKAQWQGNDLNKYNERNRNTGTTGCTFGLVSGINGDKTNVTFSSGVNGINNLFGGDTKAGKKGYSGSLQYERQGDTYTLTSATVNELAGKGASGNRTLENLDTFNNPVPCENKIYTHIWTNNFWPMDDAAQKNDINFGKVKGLNENGYAVGYGDQQFSGSATGSNAQNGNLPVSDDGKDHNSYFGMRHQVEFSLPVDYVGPLNYYFFGDDDMWVFLDDTLICDIGGVHSSVGEYVDLWDYLPKERSEKTKHTLTFFYTERGASGSTCWMQFTLPEVTGGTTLKNNELCELKIQKKVTKFEEDANGELQETNYNDGGEFKFKVWISDKDGRLLPDDYCFTKYGVDNNPIIDPETGQPESDIILHSGSGFELRNGEYVLIKNLPPGVKYKIVEETDRIPYGDIYYAAKTDISETKYQWIYPEKGEKYRQKLEPTNEIIDSQDLKLEGSVDVVSGSNDILYINKFIVYKLPSTGGSGLRLYTIVGGLCVLSGVGLVYRKRRKEVLRGRR